MRKTTLLLLSIVTLSFSSQSMDQLLSSYKSESSLGKITKSEAAGFVDIFSREDLEMMQAHTLMDILQLFSIPNVSRSFNNIAYLTKPTNSSMPNSAIRLYINDHDMAASAFGSDAMMWSSMSLEFIDHIVVYKTSSSVEFGNEPGTAIIKLYTKKPSIEQGGKVRAMVDQKGSSSLNAYYAETFKNSFSYLVYANGENIKRDKYYNQSYELNSDETSENVYANFSYKDWILELTHYKKETNSFLGIGSAYQPSGEGLHFDHDYIHLSKKFDNNFKVQISYDDLLYDSNYIDDNSSINVGDLGLVKNYYTYCKDKVFSSILEKTFETQNNKLLLGGFYKYKSFDVNGIYDNQVNNFSNALNLYSIYAEDSYSIDPTLMLVSSLKFDFYRYQKEVKSTDEYIARIGLIKNVGNFQVKAFYTKTYYAVPMAYLYSGGTNVPFKTNSNLDYAEPTLITLGVRYKSENHEAYFRFANINVKDKIAYNEASGFKNIDDKSYEQYEFNYTYKVDYANKISLDFATGSNGTSLEFSPKYIAHLIAYNRWKKLDFYNLVTYKSNYEVYGVAVGDSYNYTSSVKYHMTNDLSVGVKAENIFDTGFEQAYKGFDESIPVFDRKVWINMEYLF